VVKLAPSADWVLLRAVRRILLSTPVKAAVLVAAAASIWLWGWGFERSAAIDPLTVRENGGFAYWTAGATGLLGRFRNVLVGGPIALWPLVEVGDTGRAQSVSGLRLFEDGRVLSPAHSPHESIRESGRGRYSHWGRWLYFSTSDNTDPRSNGRTYIAADRLHLSSLVALPLFALAFVILAGASRGFARTHAHSAGIRYLRLSAGWIAHNVLPGFLITIVLLVLGAGALEIYCRALMPFSTTVWPAKFVPEVGFTFEPHAIVRNTNDTDYWTEQETNSLGFLDREAPTGPASPGMCRVVFVGDSFVEAAQVLIKDKFHILFEKAFNARSAERKIETVAFGYAGSAQIDQLPFYQHFIRPLKPDVVVLVVVNNDLANNSAVLEAIRNGWHPLHSPRLFAVRDPASGVPMFQPIDPKWRDYLLPIIPRRFGLVQSTHDWLMDHSYTYEWLFALLSRQYPPQAASISGQPSYVDVLTARLEYLRQDPLFRPLLSGWPNGTISDIDGEFFKPDPLPRVFQDALDFSDFALAQWATSVRRDGAKLLGLATATLALPGRGMKYLERVESLLRKNGIEEINQVAYSTQHGFGPTAMAYPNDGHWSPYGHQRTAEELLEYFTQHPELCDH